MAEVNIRRGDDDGSPTLIVNTSGPRIDRVFYMDCPEEIDVLLPEVSSVFEQLANTVGVIVEDAHRDEAAQYLRGLLGAIVQYELLYDSASNRQEH